ncbi:MAG TPA: hypothetical protein VGI12_22470 [Vicinamibacterales bacterium]
MISLAGFTRRRKALVSAFLPYLLLSVFVDFVHLHRLINGPVSASAASAHADAGDPAGSKPPEASCAICQWMRAGTGMQAAVSTEHAPASAATTLVARSTSPASRPEIGSPDFRGPPPALSR